jgi:hypothetical protein
MIRSQPLPFLLAGCGGVEVVDHPCGNEVEYVIVRPAGTQLLEMPDPADLDENQLLHMEVVYRGPLDAITHINHSLSQRHPTRIRENFLSEAADFVCDPEQGAWIQPLVVDVSADRGPEDRFLFISRPMASSAEEFETWSVGAYATSRFQVREFAGKPINVD